MINKTHATSIPANYWFDKLNNGDVIIYFPDNIEEVEDGFEFNLYKYRTRWTENLVERIESQFDEFKALAISQTLKCERDTRIAELKDELAKTDYKALKFVEGFISAEEYEPIRLYRQSLRDEINSLEGE